MVEKPLWKQCQLCIKSGDAPGLNELLDRHPEGIHLQTVFGSLLHIAASFGQVECCRVLLDRGLAINLTGGVSGGSALNEAASEGHLEAVRFLLACGGQLDVSNPRRNPLFGAIHGGHTDVVKLLLDAGIDFRVKYTGENMQNMDALAFAREWGRTDIAALLEAKLAE